MDMTLLPHYVKLFLSKIVSIVSYQFLYAISLFDLPKIVFKSSIEQCQLPKKCLSFLVAEMNIEHQDAKSLSAIAL